MSRNVSKKKRTKTTRSKRKLTERVLVQKRSWIQERAVTIHDILKQRNIGIEELILLVGVVFFSFWMVHKYLYYRSLTLNRVQAQAIIAVQKPAPFPTHIFIRWFIDVDIEPLAFSNGQWAVSDTKATYLIQSARPGEPGNIIIYGHNKREIMGNIRALKGGERITVQTSDGKTRYYIVKTLKEVDPSDISLLAPTKIETLTLYTCSGFWDSKRFIVQAIPTSS